MTAACHAPGAYFAQVPPQRVRVDQAVFDIRLRDDLAEVQRVNAQYAPRLGPLATRAKAAVEHVSGCQAAQIRGDQAYMLVTLDCGSGVRRFPSAPRALDLDCMTLDVHVSAATDELVLDLDCTPF